MSWIWICVALVFFLCKVQSKILNTTTTDIFSSTLTLTKQSKLNAVTIFLWKYRRENIKLPKKSNCQIKSQVLQIPLFITNGLKWNSVKQTLFVFWIIIQTSEYLNLFYKWPTLKLLFSEKIIYSTNKVYILEATDQTIEVLLFKQA